MSVTAAVALYAAVVATGGLGWQVYAFRRNERARKEDSATKVDVGVRMGMAGTVPPLELLTVKFVNHSNHPIKVTGVSFIHQDKAEHELVSFAFVLGSALPQTVERHDAGEVMFDSARVRSGEDALDVYRPVTALVKLSTGEVFRSLPQPLLRRGPPA